MKLLRSALFVPGHRERMVAKALGLAADGLFIDLEDSVPTAEKDAARAAADVVLGSGAAPAVCVRTNAVRSSIFFDDVAAWVRPGLQAVLLPKVETSDDLLIADYVIGVIEERHDLPPGSVAIIASLETAAGVSNCGSIVRASPRTKAIVVGIAEDGDLHRDLGYTRTDSGIELAYVLGHILVEARAAGISQLIAGPTVAIDDPDRVRADAAFAKRMGMTGKAAIHPNQLDAINEAFAPTDEEIAYFERVVAAVNEAHAKGIGAVTVDGRMVDQAMLTRAQSVLRATANDS